MFRIIESKLKIRFKDDKKGQNSYWSDNDYETFFNHIIRTRTKEITKCGLISRSVREINMLSVKIESNTGPIGQLFC